MKLSKDEARILALMLEEHKYEYAKCVPPSNQSIDAFTALQWKLGKFGNDQRRKGRTSMNDFSDCLKRFVKKHFDNKHQPTPNS